MNSAFLTLETAIEVVEDILSIELVETCVALTSFGYVQNFS